MKGARYLYGEFSLDDRRELDDTTMEILGFKNPDECAIVMDRIYRDVMVMQQSTSSLSEEWLT